MVVASGEADLEGARVERGKARRQVDHKRLAGLPERNGAWMTQQTDLANAASKADNALLPLSFSSVGRAAAASAHSRKHADVVHLIAVGVL